MIDIEKVRADTPAMAHRIYLNHAGSSLMPAPAFAAMTDYLEREQAIGGYETAEERTADAARFYQEAARLYGCSAEEIAFCTSDSDAWLKLFLSLHFSAGDRIVTTQLDYGSHFVSFIQMARKGVETIVIGCDSNGDLDLIALENAVDERTRLITTSHVPTSGGTISAAAKIGEIARKAGVPFVLDACQSSGQITVNVREIGCSALTATGRKYLRGPRGSGLLYVEHAFLEELEPAALDQFGVELLSASHYRLLAGSRRFENFEVSHAARVGLGAAIAYANAIGIPCIEERIRELGQVCRQLLAEVPAITVQDRGRHLGGIVTFSVRGRTADEICQYLLAHHVHVSVSSGSGGLVDFQARGIQSLVRASVHYFNTVGDIRQMVRLLARLP